MKGQKHIIGKKIVKVENCHDYAIVILEDGTELEVAGITVKRHKKPLTHNQQLLDKWGKTLCYGKDFVTCLVQDYREKKQ